MYNEVKRFYLFRRRRWADTLFDTLYHVIFILGFYSLLRGNSDFQLSYFYYYFILTHVVSLGNEELEYEIRSGQSFGTQYALQSVYRIYLQRAVVYFVWLSLIFWIALLLIHQGLPTHFSLVALSITASRTSLVCTWPMRALWLRATRAGSPPPQVTWPVSSSSPTASPVEAISRSISASVCTMVPIWWW